MTRISLLRARRRSHSPEQLQRWSKPPPCGFISRVLFLRLLKALVATVQSAGATYIFVLFVGQKVSTLTFGGPSRLTPATQQSGNFLAHTHQFNINVI